MGGRWQMAPDSNGRRAHCQHAENCSGHWTLGASFSLRRGTTHACRFASHRCRNAPATFKSQSDDSLFASWRNLSSRCTALDARSAARFTAVRRSASWSSIRIMPVGRRITVTWQRLSTPPRGPFTSSSFTVALTMRSPKRLSAKRSRRATSTRVASSTMSFRTRIFSCIALGASAWNNNDPRTRD